eukprot:tig00000480_g1337.t1
MAEVQGVTVVVRVIKSFEYRTFKNLVLHNVDLGMRVADFRQLVDQKIQTEAGFAPYRNHKSDTLKLHMKAHGAKTSNPVINVGHEELVLKETGTLGEQGVEHETELSYFAMSDYEAYKANPQVKW